MDTPWIVTYTRPDWKKTALGAVVAYGIAIAFRLLEAPGWENPLYHLDGEMLLATHDAYHWAAGAAGFEFGAGHPMSVLIGLLSRLTGLSPAQCAFWMPPFLASLVAPLVVIWAAVFGARTGGVAAGVLASLAPGYLGRTLLGFGDTDLVTLLFSLLLGLPPALWLAPWLRSPAAVMLHFLGIGRRSIKQTNDSGNRRLPLSGIWPWILFFTGCFGWWGQDWHSLFPYLVRGYAGLTPVLILLFAQPNLRQPLLVGALVYAFPMVGGAAGAIPGFLLALWGKTLLDAIKKKRVRQGLLLALWLAVAFFMIDPQVIRVFTRSFLSYIKPQADFGVAAMKTGGPGYPATAPSIIEIQDLGVPEILAYLHPWMAVALAGVAGFAVLLFITPTATFQLPLVALAFLGTKMGGRMVMFGAASVALGFAVPLCRLAGAVLERWMPRLFSGSARAAAVVLPEAILCLFVFPCCLLIPHLTQGPVLDVEHARALRTLERETPSDSVIWDWWDFGYSAHYFSRRKTLADGARHADAHLYLPALVYATDNPRLAAGIMRAAASRDSPNDVLAGKTPEEARAFLEELEKGGREFPPGPPQYLVVSSDLLRLAYWVSLYGTWDFVEKRGAPYGIGNLTVPLKFLLKNGSVVTEGLPPVLADTITVLRDNGTERKAYERFNNRHFIFNAIRGEKFSLDERLYNSLMVQLLVAPPDDPRFTPYFTLVYDSPLCRVYRLNQGEGRERPGGPA